MSESQECYDDQHQSCKDKYCDCWCHGRRPRTATEQDRFERERIARVKGKARIERGKDIEAALLEQAMVRGRTIRITRLDADGKPTGPTLLGGWVDEAEGFPETDEDDGEFLALKDEATRRFAAGLTMQQVDPDMIALLFGYTLKPRPWWWKFLPRAIQHKIKRRELRRAYGG